MNITLTPEQQQFVAEQVESGRFPSESEVVREALQCFIEHKAAIGEIAEKIERAEADVAAGRLYSPQQARDMLRERRTPRVGQR